ncbi:uncharacterized protein [Nicotiana tomentosiformis]|uniref:uncharacterized protein n=1 Tax=Nicotiana tomentosiformis TaxID=4098 RepID=UPI00388C36D1
MTLVMLGFAKIEWRCSLDYVSSRVISYLKAQQMVGKGCLSYLAFVRDVGADTPTIDSVSVVRDFSDVFPAELPGMPPDRDIDYGERPLTSDIQALANQLVMFDVSEPSRVFTCVVSQSSLYDRIRERQYHDPHLLVLKDTIQHDNSKEVTIGDNGALRMQGRICVPNVDGLRERLFASDVQALANQFVRLDVSEPSQGTVQHGGAKEVTIRDDRVLRMQGRIYVPDVDGLRELILEESHSLRYCIHPGAAKMYQYLRQHYWWMRMKKDIVGFVARCLNCQQAQSRQRSYTDRKVRDVAYMVGENVFLRVSPMKGVMWFGKKVKLSPQYIGPFEVLERIGEVAYKLAFPPSLSSIHPVFHVSMLRKYVGNTSHVLDLNTV